MADENENEETAAAPAPRAAVNGGSAPKVTPVARAAPKVAPGFGKVVVTEWKPEDGWKGRYADDRWGEVAARAKLKGHELRDIRITISRLNRDQSEQRLCTFSGDTVEGRNNPYTTGGNTGLGGVVSPSDALFDVVRRYHAGSTENGVYNIEFWDLRNDSKQITSAMLPIAPSGQTGKMEQIIASVKQPQGDGGGFDPTVRPPQGFGSPQGPAGYSGYSGAPSGSYPQYAPPQGTDPTVIGLFNQMQEMQRRHYEEMRAMAERAGAPPPAPPPGLGNLPEDPRIALLQKELELTRAQLPKPKSEVEVLAEKMVSGFASILDKKFPNVGIGAAVGNNVGVGSPEATPQKPQLTRIQQMEAQLEEEEKLWSLEERFKKMRAKYGLGEPEEVPEVVATPAEPPKPEDKLPVNLVPIEGLQLFGQPFHSVSRKDGEEVGLGQQIIDHIMYNPGAQEQAMRFVMAVGEKVAEPLMNVLTRIGQATKPNGGNPGAAQAQVGVGNPPSGNSGGSGSSFKAEVVNEVPQGAVDAGDGSGNEGVI